MASTLVKLAMAYDLTEQVGPDCHVDALFVTEQGQVVVVMDATQAIPGKSAGDAWQGSNGKSGVFGADVCAETGYRDPWFTLADGTRVCVGWSLRRVRPGAAAVAPAKATPKRRGLVQAGEKR